jgi:methionyl-tRNA formyltransferase
MSLAKRQVMVVAVVVGPNVSPIESEKILSCWPLRPPLIQTARPDLDSSVIHWADGGGIDLLLSIFFEYRVRPSLLEKAKMGGINIHPSALPHNGGFHTSFWGIINKTPLGATLMWMDEGLDTGGIIAQKVFSDNGIMGANEVRSRQRQLCFELFEENIDNLICGLTPYTKGQPCSYHFKKDIVEATTFDEDDLVSFGRLMLLGRATYHGGNGLTVRTKEGNVFKLHIFVDALTPLHSGEKL